MIPIILWREDLDGTSRGEVILSCESVSAPEQRLNYRSSRTLKGKKFQDWYSTYKTFSFSVPKMSKEDYLKLHSLLSSQEGILKIVYDNSVYEVVHESDSVGEDPSWGNVSKSMYTDIQITLEQSSAQSSEVGYGL